MCAVRVTYFAVLLLFLLAVVPSRLGFGGENVINADEVPKVVIAALNNQYPRAHVLSWSRVDEVFLANIRLRADDDKDEVRKRELDVIYSSDGGFVQEVEELPLDVLPVLVRRAIAEGEYARTKIASARKIARGDKRDVVEYDVDFETPVKGGAGTQWAATLTFSQVGKVTEELKRVELAELPAAVKKSINDGPLKENKGEIQLARKLTEGDKVKTVSYCISLSLTSKTRSWSEDHWYDVEGKELDGRT